VRRIQAPLQDFETAQLVKIVGLGTKKMSRWQKSWWAIEIFYQCIVSVEQSILKNRLQKKLLINLINFYRNFPWTENICVGLLSPSQPQKYPTTQCEKRLFLSDEVECYRQFFPFIQISFHFIYSIIN
jgi:hypothetical protein